MLEYDGKMSVKVPSVAAVRQLTRSTLREVRARRWASRSIVAITNAIGRRIGYQDVRGGYCVITEYGNAEGHPVHERPRRQSSINGVFTAGGSNAAYAKWPTAWRAVRFRRADGPVDRDWRGRQPDR